MKLNLLMCSLICFSVVMGVGDDLKKFDLDQESDIVSDVLQKTILSPEEQKFQEWVGKRAQQSKQDFTKYISKYFPKVFSVRERFFSKMTPEGIAEGFKEIIDMISEKPWFYVEQLFKQISKILTPEERKKWKESGYDFASLPKKFDEKNVKKWLNSGGGFWDFIADQLCFYNEFLECAKVDPEMNVVFLKKSEFAWENFSDFKSLEKDDSGKAESLKEYWAKKGIEIHYEFYALCFDYYVKLFIENILQKNLDLACRYQTDLKVIMNKLMGSDYEAERQDNMKDYRELIEILKHKNKEEEKVFGSAFEEFIDFWDV
jgi:hypothetical protein